MTYGTQRNLEKYEITPYCLTLPYCFARFLTVPIVPYYPIVPSFPAVPYCSVLSLSFPTVPTVAYCSYCSLLPPTIPHCSYYPHCFLLSPLFPTIPIVSYCPSTASYCPLHFFFVVPLFPFFLCYSDHSILAK